MTAHRLSADQLAETRRYLKFTAVVPETHVSQVAG